MSELKIDDESNSDVRSTSAVSNQSDFKRRQSLKTEAEQILAKLNRSIMANYWSNLNQVQKRHASYFGGRKSQNR